MFLDLVFHKEEKPAETSSIERPVLAKAHVDCRPCVGDGVYYFVDVSYSCGVSGMEVRGRDVEIEGDFHGHWWVYVPWRTQNRDMGTWQRQCLS